MGQSLPRECVCESFEHVSSGLVEMSFNLQESVESAVPVHIIDGYTRVCCQTCFGLLCSRPQDRYGWN